MISFDLSSPHTCPRVMPFSDAQTPTICMGCLATLPIKRSGQPLAIYGNYLAVAQLIQRHHPAGETALKLSRIELSKDAPECVMGR